MNKANTKIAKRAHQTRLAAQSGEMHLQEAERVASTDMTPKKTLSDGVEVLREILISAHEFRHQNRMDPQTADVPEELQNKLSAARQWASTINAKLDEKAMINSVKPDSDRFRGWQTKVMRKIYHNAIGLEHKHDRLVLVPKGPESPNVSEFRISERTNLSEGSKDMKFLYNDAKPVYQQGLVEIIDSITDYAMSIELDAKDVPLDEHVHTLKALDAKIHAANKFCADTGIRAKEFRKTYSGLVKEIRNRNAEGKNKKRKRHVNLLTAKRIPKLIHHDKHGRLALWLSPKRLRSFGIDESSASNALRSEKDIEAKESLSKKADARVVEVAQPVPTASILSEDPGTPVDEKVTSPSESASRTSRVNPEASPVAAETSMHEKPDLHEAVHEDEDDGPVSVPYTTAASNFLYGSNTVLAALRANTRKLYHLYLNPRLSSRETLSNSIENMARNASIPCTRNAPLSLLDKMSDNRPHNGVVMEVSRLPAPPVLSVGKPDLKNSLMPLNLDRQSAEDLAVNGGPSSLPTATTTWRNPFILMLDGILDPGNVGSILRTAHFYGVDAVAIATGTCANLNSPALAKASSGACEGIPLFALPKPANFISQSKRNGWRIYAAVAPPPPGLGQTLADKARATNVAALSTASPLAKDPCILMLGAEGEGLRENLCNKADVNLSIERGAPRDSAKDVGVDSLNVGVSAGVLVEAFLKRPAGMERGSLGF